MQFFRKSLEPTPPPVPHGPATESDKLAALASDADSKLAAFRQAVAAAREAEAQLFTVLFSRSRGLSQQFTDPQVTVAALKARGKLRQRLLRFAEETRYAVNGQFETVAGDAYLGLDVFYLRRAQLQSTE